MTVAQLWDGVAARLAAHGWATRVVPIERLEGAQARVAAVFASGELAPATVRRLSRGIAFDVSGCPFEPRSVVVGAVARPLTRATLTVGGEQVTVAVPPHYAGYATVPDDLTRLADESLALWGHAARRVDPPLKTLAVGAGLARYGRNTIAYVDGLGSYLQLAACVSDAAPPESQWLPPRSLERCERCRACVRACPTGAIDADRFLLEMDRCLTWVNEDPAPFPAWIDPAWHACAVGCLRCQRACPENARIALAEPPPEAFDEREATAILAGANNAALPAGTRAKLVACGLDYSPEVIARNLRVLLRLA
jgi:epoxyqueuosine reductase